MTGSGGQRRVPASFLAELKVPLPSLSEQRRIAEVLDRAETLRAQRRLALAKLAALAESIFLDMFEDSAAKAHGWPVVGINEACEIIVDCVNRTAPIVEDPTPFKMIRTTNVKAGRVDLTEVRFVTEETFTRWNRRTVPRRGDVLLTREAPVGEVGILESDDQVFLGQRLMLYRVDPRRMTAEYLVAAFRSSLLQRQFAAHGSGSTVKHLPLPACRSFQIVLPPLAVQQHYSCRMRKLDELRSVGSGALSNLDALFAALQHRAFRGEL